jgi:hypothetical protein
VPAGRNSAQLRLEPRRSSATPLASLDPKTAKSGHKDGGLLSSSYSICNHRPYKTLLLICLVLPAIVPKWTFPQKPPGSLEAACPASPAPG